MLTHGNELNSLRDMMTCGDWFQFMLAGFGDAINWTNFYALRLVEMAFAFNAGIGIDDKDVWTFGYGFCRANGFASSAINAGFVNE